jgi:hypothetical protein
MDLTTRLPEADGAFVGIYVDRHSADERRAAWTFEVERVVKGSFGPTAIVRTSSSGASCGIELFDSPRTGLLLDRAKDGVWESSLCQQISPEQLLAFVPNSKPPDPAIPPISAGWSFVSKAIGVGLLLAAAVVLSLRSARRRPSPSGESDVT